MTNKLVLHSSTQQEVDKFVAAPSHNLLLVGPDGAGKPTLALFILSQLLGDKLTDNPYFLHLSPIKQTLTIDQVRSAQNFVKLRTTGQKTLRRAILVEDAQTLNDEAQNAFLKLLEEPPADTVIVLTTSSMQALLPTIRSRIQKIDVKAPLRVDLEAYFKAPASQMAAAYYMSNGQAGLMSRILQNKNDDDLLHYIAEAKQVIKMPSFERMVYVDSFIKGKQSPSKLFWALQAIGNAAMRKAADRSDRKMVLHWLVLLKSLHESSRNLSANPNQKLLLTSLLLSF